MIHGDGPDVDELGEIILVGHVVPMPSNHIKRGVILSTAEELATKLVNNLPRIIVGDLELCLGVKEVTRIGKTIRTQGSKLWQFEVGTPYLQDVTSRRPLDCNPKAETTLNDTNLARLNVKRPELRLDIQGALLWNDKEVPV